MTVLYPININIKDRKCVVVGGGKVAERKIFSLIESAAEVIVVSPSLTEAIKELADEKKIKVKNRSFMKNLDIDNAFLIIAATNCDKINKEIAELCKERNILVNIVDNPEDSTFHVPSLLRRGALSITISTNGKSPALAAKIKKDLSDQYGEEYAKYLELLGEIRQRVLAEVENPEKRKEIFNRIIESDLLDLIKQDENGLVKERINKCLS